MYTCEWTRKVKVHYRGPWCEKLQKCFKVHLFFHSGFPFFMDYHLHILQFPSLLWILRETSGRCQFCGNKSPFAICLSSCFLINGLMALRLPGSQWANKTLCSSWWKEHLNGPHQTDSQACFWIYCPPFSAPGCSFVFLQMFQYLWKARINGMVTNQGSWTVFWLLPKISKHLERFTSCLQFL